MDEPVPTYGLLYITQAYNRKEITLEEWLVLSREWAERMIAQYGERYTEGANESSYRNTGKKASA